MSLLQSSSPRIAQHLRGTALTGASDKQLGQWGGAVHSRAQVEGALASLDGVIVLLELAGYVVDSVAFAVAKENTTHKNADAVVLHLPALKLTRGVEQNWPARPGAPGAPLGRLGLWVRPLQGSMSADHWLDGCSVNLRDDIPQFSERGIGVDFSPTSEGWFTLTVVQTNGWTRGLLDICEAARGLLCSALAGRIAALVDGEPLTRPGFGLLAMLDPSTWLCGDPFYPLTQRPFPAEGISHDLAAALFAAFTADPATFLLQDVSYPALPAVRRIAMLDPGDDTAPRWSALLDDLGGIDGSPTAVAELRPEYGELLSWTHILLWAHELGMLDALSTIAAAQPVLRASPVPYGGYELRRGDDDLKTRWGGQLVGAEDRHPAHGEAGFVSQLQADLLRVGIRLQQINGKFDAWTEMAVREFEIAARFAYVARPRADAGVYDVLPEDALERVAVPESNRLSGPILGVLTSAVAAVLRLWVSAGWRYPIVLYAVRSRIVTLINVWRWNEVREGRVWAWDCSGEYSVLPSRQLPYYVGAWTSRFNGGPATSRDDVKRGRLWPEAALTPERLAGPQMAHIPESARTTDATWSTYRVIAAVAGVEMIDQFDALNAYDPGVISFGLYHWILGGGEQDAELGALFALLRARDSAAFEAVMGRFGVQPTRTWGEQKMFAEDLATYNCQMAMRRPDGLWAAVPGDMKDWFRGWSWFYRLQMACRTSEPLQRTMWELGRLRVRDLLNLSWPNRNLKFREIFKSERLVAMILRWHVNKPRHMQRSDSPLFTRPLPAGGPSTWDSAQFEQTLVDLAPGSLKDASSLKATLTVIREDSDLADAYGSFHFDDSGL